MVIARGPDPIVLGLILLAAGTVTIVVLAQRPTWTPYVSAFRDGVNTGLEVTRK